MTKRKIPPVKIPESSERPTLPFNGNAVAEKGFSLSFSCFDRTHRLFNLGDNTEDKVISGKWFLDLLDCLKNVCNMTIPQLKTSMYDLHPIDWDKTNVDKPIGAEQLEYWQLRINKSRGRIIGIMLPGFFYVVWLDPHHNLTDSEGYGKATEFKRPKSEYEEICDKLEFFEKEIACLRGELATAEEIINEN